MHEVLVCNPRRNALLKAGSKNDKVDARKLSDLLRTGMLRPVYHGEHGLRRLRELARSYQTMSQDLSRVINRIKALYRGWGIPCAGTQVYAPRYRQEWLEKIEHSGVRRRAELLYQQLDGLQALRRSLRPELLAESQKHNATKLLRQIPCIGPIRAARLLALMQTPHRFRSKRQLWTYSGLGIETRDSAQYRFVRGQLQLAKKPQQRLRPHPSLRLFGESLSGFPSGVEPTTTGFEQRNSRTSWNPRRALRGCLSLALPTLWRIDDRDSEIYSGGVISMRVLRFFLTLTSVADLGCAEARPRIHALIERQRPLSPPSTDIRAALCSTPHTPI